MKKLSYVIQNENGIHARPAGLFVKECGRFSSNIQIEVNGKAAQANKLFALMGLCAKKGDRIRISIEGNDEETACQEIQTFMTKHF